MNLSHTSEHPRTPGPHNSAILSRDLPWRWPADDPDLIVANALREVLRSRRLTIAEAERQCGLGLHTLSNTLYSKQNLTLRTLARLTRGLSLLPEERRSLLSAMFAVAQAREAEGEAA